MNIQNAEIFQEVAETIRDQQEPEAKSDLKTGIVIDKDLSVPLVAINDTGVFVVIGIHGNDIRKDIENLTAKFFLPEQSYFFVQDPDRAWFWDEEYEQLIPIKDLYTGFFNIYFAVVSGNMLALQKQGITPAMCAIEEDPAPYDICETRPLVSKVRLDAVRDALAKEADKPVTIRDEMKRSMQRYYISNGTKYVRKLDSFGREEYCRVSNADPDEFYKVALFGGMFGLHKFKDGQILKGIGYLVSGGLFGAFWVIDLLMILLGNYRMADGSYLDRPNYKKALLMLPAGLLFGGMLLAIYYFAVREIYSAMANGIVNSKIVEKYAENKSQELIGQIQNQGVR